MSFLQNNNKYFFLIIGFFALVFAKVNAQTELKLGNNPGAIHSSAAFEIESTAKGLLMPRLTTVQMNAMPLPIAKGLMIFNTDLNCIHYYNGGWKSQCDPANLGAWSLLGNANTTATTNFIGTTNAEDVVFKANNTEKMRILNAPGTNGGLDIKDHLVVGANGTLDDQTTALVQENYSELGNIATYGLRTSQTRTETAPNSTGQTIGIHNSLTYRVNGASSNSGKGLYSAVISDQNTSPFGYLRGGEFVARTNSTLTSGQYFMSGLSGSAQNSGTGAVRFLYGLYGSADVNGTGTVTQTAAGVSGRVLIGNNSTMAIAIGVKGSVDRRNLSSTIIGGSYGGLFEANNTDNTVGVLGNASVDTTGTFTNMYGGQFRSVIFGTSAGTIINNHGLYTISLKNGGSGTITNSYGAKILAQDGNTLNSAVHAQTLADGTDNYLYYGLMSGALGNKWGIYLTGEDKNYFSGNVGIGTTTPNTKLDIDGAMALRPSAKSITADNQAITVGDRSFLRITPNAVPASRTITLSNGLQDGQQLIIRVSATGINGIELADSGNLNLSGTAILDDGDTITLIWDGTDWFELYRSSN